MANYHETKERLEEQQKSLVSFLKSPNGKHALEFLRAKYATGRIHVNGDPYATHVRIGERQVIDYLTELAGEE